MTAKEALRYLDDIAHGRKMEYDPHELKNMVERELDVLEILKQASDDEVYKATKKTQMVFFLADDGREDYKKVQEWLEEKE